MKLWAGVSLYALVFLCVSAGIIMAIMVTGWQNGVIYTWEATSNQTLEDIVQVLDQNLNFVKFSAQSVPYIVPQISKTGNRGMPFSGFDPYMLMRMFDAYDGGATGYSFGSFGFMTRNLNSTNPLSKLSWQIAKGFGCDPYMYAYSDASFNPSFLGYCISANGTVDFVSGPAYMGFDWGLAPNEAAMIAGTLGPSYLPITNLLGQFMLTYETIDAAQAPYISFASIDLKLFSLYVAKNVTLFNGKGIVFVYETLTGAMIASTIADTVVDSTNNNERQFAFNASRSSDIQNIYNRTRASDAWLIQTFQRYEPGINWTITVAIRRQDVYGNMYHTTMVAGLICMGVILVCVGFLIFGIWRCVGRSLKNMKNKIDGNPHSELSFSRFSDVQDVEYAIIK